MNEKKEIQMQICRNLDLKYRNMTHYTVKKLVNKLEKLMISDYHGLRSTGLTCFLNSVLQVLFMTVDFREAVKRSGRKDPTSIDHHLRELFCTLEQNMARTDDIIRELGIKDVYEQRDAAEYLEKILCRTSLEASKIFKGELNHKTTCLNCKKPSSSKNFFLVLPLSMGDSRSRSYSVLDGLNSFFKAQRVSEDNQMFCNICNQKQDTDIEYEMIRCPDVLTLLLKRFSFDYQQNCYVKLKCKADVVQTLEIQSCRYDLYAVVHHFGDLMGGHYTADIKSFETGYWYCFNDNTVKCVNKLYFKSGSNSIRSTTAYLLMYKMVSGRAMKNNGRSPEAPSDETEHGFHEGETRPDLISEELLKTTIEDKVVKETRLSCLRGGNEQSNHLASQEIQGLWLSSDTDTRQRFCYNSTEIYPTWTFDQSSVPPSKDVGGNEDNKAKTGRNGHHYHYSPPRILSADRFNYGEALAATRTKSRTVYEGIDVINYVAKSQTVYPSLSSPKRSNSFKGTERLGAIYSSAISQMESLKRKNLVKQPELKKPGQPWK
ncbi:ubiquitin carboxyl-terminal hydrolase 47-like [Cyprinodon tularosa]|uniref:ubiquitin carboxyl-terminal hydrolase 47-like n=1 Tax=Cyprinodon tularosa TaxID=77115 RepID=UPI0018E27B7F|nr:ubiquitin carboxyl-terminal hydrolase 47-like [Cyprinodon tularosa]